MTSATSSSRTLQAAFRRGIVVYTGTALPYGTRNASAGMAGAPAESTASPIRPYYLPLTQSAPLEYSIRSILTDSRAAPGRAASLDRALVAKAPVWSALTLIVRAP
jgi:hypothetical protein